MQLTFTEMHTPTVGLQIQVTASFTPKRATFSASTYLNARSSAAFSRSTAT